MFYMGDFSHANKVLLPTLLLFVVLFLNVEHISVKTHWELAAPYQYEFPEMSGIPTSAPGEVVSDTIDFLDTTLERQYMVCTDASAPAGFQENYAPQLVASIAMGNPASPACRVQPDGSVFVESTGATCAPKQEPLISCPTAVVTFEIVEGSTKPKLLTRCWDKQDSPIGGTMHTTRQLAGVSAAMEIETIGPVCAPSGVPLQAMPSIVNAGSYTADVVVDDAVGVSAGSAGGTLVGADGAFQGEVSPTTGGVNASGNTIAQAVSTTNQTPPVSEAVSAVTQGTGVAAQDTNPVASTNYHVAHGTTMQGTSGVVTSGTGATVGGGAVAAPGMQPLTAPQKIVQGYGSGRAIFAHTLGNEIATSFQNAYTATQNGQYVGQVHIPQAVQYIVVDANGNPLHTTAIERAATEQSYTTIKTIAQDVAYRNGTSTALQTRAEGFQQTLAVVGGPNAYANAGTRNESYGKIQDLIIENDAMEALTEAEVAATKAKNLVFCEDRETSADCLARREQVAEQVERDTFVAGMEDRSVPNAAIKHFLAVYDGVIDPSPAPETFATSTLKAMYAQDANGNAPYTMQTNATDFVLWIVDSVAQKAKNTAATVVDTVTGWFSGGDTTTNTATTTAQ